MAACARSGCSKVVDKKADLTSLKAFDRWWHGDCLVRMRLLFGAGAAS
jgi:hypothetical protein